jgi:uncharacterized protein YgbK (DUF1537 family)
LAAGIVKQLSGGVPLEVPPVPMLERLLMVCGTASNVTHLQLNTLMDRYPGSRFELEPDWLARASDLDRARRSAEMLRTAAGWFLVLQIRGLPPTGANASPLQIAEGLAALACEMVRTNEFDGVFLSGGDTAEAFRHTTGGEAIRLERELLPGLVLGHWLGGVAGGLKAITKPGAFGSKQTLVKLCEQLRGGAKS